MRPIIFSLWSLYLVVTLQSALLHLWSILESVIPAYVNTEVDFRQLFISHFEASPSGLSLTYIGILDAPPEGLSLIGAVSAWLEERAVINEEDYSVRFKEDWVEPGDIFHPTIGVMASLYHSFHCYFHMTYAYCYLYKRSDMSASSQTTVTLPDKAVEEIRDLGHYDSFYNGWKQAVEDIINRHLFQ